MKKRQIAFLCVGLALLSLFVALTFLLFGGVIVSHGPSLDRPLVKRLTPKAEGGDGEACWCLYLSYLYIDDKKAEQWLAKGAYHSNSKAQYRKYENLKYSNKVDTLEERLNLLRGAATQDVPGAQEELGDLYGHGGVVERDPKQAEYWYRRAAMNGNKSAMLKLARHLKDTRSDRNGLTEAYAWTLVGLSRAGKNINLANNLQELQDELIKRAKKFNHPQPFVIRQGKDGGRP
jgi:TPR repeat protein